MNTKTNAQNIAFDLKTLGLSDAQLRAIAGARPAEKTSTVTSAGVTKCCW